mmetsp:Transcript_140534/g.449162  ORF Transcript_140534/g.449162 Transcript_140534/m.449162 type:complete len:208 (-) Transcript_140534:3598-4221(-)
MDGIGHGTDAGVGDLHDRHPVRQQGDEAQRSDGHLVLLRALLHGHGLAVPADLLLLLPRQGGGGLWRSDLLRALHALLLLQPLRRHYGHQWQELDVLDVLDRFGRWLGHDRQVGGHRGGRAVGQPLQCAARDLQRPSADRRPQLRPRVDDARHRYHLVPGARLVHREGLPWHAWLAAALVLPAVAVVLAPEGHDFCRERLRRVRHDG